MSKPEARRPQAEAELPAWGLALLALVEELPPTEPDEELSALAVALTLPEARVRRFVQAAAAGRDLHELHAFLRQAIRNPRPLIRELETGRATRFSPAWRERLVPGLQALALAVVARRRMRSYWTFAFRHFQRVAEEEVAQVAVFLDRLVGPAESARRLMRRLHSRDSAVREYALYVLSEYAHEPHFGRHLARLEAMAEREEDPTVREAWSYLFSFGGRG